jgi:Ca2+-binding RTX toxin-like protein
MAWPYNSDFYFSHYNRVTTTAWGLPIDNTANLINGTELGSNPENGNDLIVAGSGNDRINANGGNDVVSGGRGNDTISTGWGNDTLFFEQGSGNDIVKDFGHSLGNLDQIVVDGKYLGASSSFLGTTLKFDYDGNGSVDGTVLLAGVSGSAWQRYLADGALVDNSAGKAWSDPTTVAQVDALVHHHDMTGMS